MTISKDKQYKTREGKPARILTTDLKGKLSVAVAVQEEDEELLLAYNNDGSLYNADVPDLYDLVEVKPRHKRWIVTYPIYGYATKEEAQRTAKWMDRKEVSVVEIEFEEGEGLA